MTNWTEKQKQEMIENQNGDTIESNIKRMLKEQAQIINERANLDEPLITPETIKAYKEGFSTIETPEIPEAQYIEPQEPQNFVAEVNMYNQNNTDYIILQTPGFESDDIDAYIEEGILVVEGSLDPVDVEVSYNSQEFLEVLGFKNKFQLGKRTKVDTVAVKAGICTIKLATIQPKREMLEVA